MSLQIDGDIESEVSFTSPTDLELGTDVAYATIYEYTYNRDDIHKLLQFNGNAEQNNIKDMVLAYFARTGLNECTIRVEG